MAKKKLAAKKVKAQKPPPEVLRLELIAGKSAKFWQVELDGKRVTVTFGRIGSEGQRQVKSFKNEWTARHARNEQLREKIAKGYGYQLPATPAPVVAARDAQLEQRILDDPDSDDGFAVYADWLQEQGDVRGELAVLHQRLAKKPNDKKLRAAEARLRWDYRSHFYGQLAMFASEPEELQKKKIPVRTWNAPPIQDSWRYGWIDRLELGKTDATTAAPLWRTAALIELLPRVPSARFVRELVIARPTYADQYNFGDCIEALVEAIPHLPALQRLTIGKFDYTESELSWSYLGKLDALWKVAGQLRHLKLRAGSMELGKLNLPELRSLEIETGGLTRESLRSITKASWPNLERLSIWFGKLGYGCTCRPADVAPILDGASFPRLVHLGLKNSQWGDELAPLLVRSKVLRRIRSLDVSMSNLTTAGIAVYAQHADALAHLEAWNLERCLLDPAAQKQAKKILKVAALDGQRDPASYADSSESYRYAAVGE